MFINSVSHIPDEEIVATGEIPLEIWSELHQSAGPSVSIVRNHSDPTLTEHGITGITVEPLSDGVYKLSYTGYQSGELAVSADGIQQMGAHLFDDRMEVPDRLLKHGDSTADRPTFI